MLAHHANAQTLLQIEGPKPQLVYKTSHVREEVSTVTYKPSPTHGPIFHNVILT